MYSPASPRSESSRQTCRTGTGLSRLRCSGLRRPPVRRRGSSRGEGAGGSVVGSSVRFARQELSRAKLSPGPWEAPIPTGFPRKWQSAQVLRIGNDPSRRNRDRPLWWLTSWLASCRSGAHHEMVIDRFETISTRIQPNLSAQQWPLRVLPKLLDRFWTIYSHSFLKPYLIAAAVQPHKAD
jgi:hypothetical protein